MEIKVNQEKVADYGKQLRDFGANIGDQYSDKITQVATKLMEMAAESQGIDLEMAVAESGEDTVQAMLWNSDEFMNIVVELSEQMIAGISDMWPYPIGVNDFE